jgi:hypothetical protein
MLTYAARLVVEGRDWTCPHTGCWMLQSLDLAGDILNVAK